MATLLVKTKYIKPYINDSKYENLLYYHTYCRFFVNYDEFLKIVPLNPNIRCCLKVIKTLYYEHSKYTNNLSNNT